MEFRRITNLPPYVFTIIDGLKIAARHAGEDVIDLGFGNPDLPSPQVAVDKLCEAAHNPRNHRYSSSRGIPKLREAVAALYSRRFGVDLDPEREVIATIGAKEGFSHLMWVLLGQGDAALVPSPSYPIHIWGPLFAGADVREIPMGGDEDFFANVQEAYRYSWPKPRVIVLSFPHNPTTTCVDLAFMQRMVDFARENGVVLVHDNAYAELGFDGYEPPSIMQAEGAKECAVELYSMTKSFSMAGWRMAFVVGNPEIVGALTKLKSYLDYGTFQPIQIASTVTLNEDPDHPREVQPLYQSRRDALCDGLNRIGWELTPPRGTMFVWAPIPEPYREMGSVEFASYLVREANVATSPGVGFGPGGDGHVRFALIENEQRIAQGVRNLRKALVKLREDSRRYRNAPAQSPGRSRKARKPDADKRSRTVRRVTTSTTPGQKSTGSQSRSNGRSPDGDLSSLLDPIVLPERRPDRDATRPRTGPGSLARRRRRRKQLIAATCGLLCIILLALSWSVVGALRTPGNEAFKAKWADSLRDHHAGFLIQRFENAYFASKQPPKGGTVTRLHALPGAQVAPNKPQHHTPGTTLPPHLALPGPVPLVVSPAAPGEGQWKPVGPLVDGLPTMAVAQFRADDIYTSQLASAVWVDTKLLRLRLMAGAQEPGNVAGPHAIEGDALANIAAAFNGGFRFKDARGGFYLNGQEAVPLVDGAASIVIHTDGSVEIGSWNREVHMSDSVEAVLQNLTLMVDGGKLDERISHNDSSMWGQTLKGSIAVARSGIGVTADGALIYVAGPSLTAKSLAESLQRAGAVRAMTLDINPEWVTFLFYSHPDPANPANVVGAKLYPEITRPSNRYLSSDSRDFFTISTR